MSYKIIITCWFCLLFTINTDGLRCFVCDTSRDIQCKESRIRRCVIKVIHRGIKVRLTRCVKLVFSNGNNTFTAKNCSYAILDSPSSCNMLSRQVLNFSPADFVRNKVQCYVCKRDFCNSTSKTHASLKIQILMCCVMLLHILRYLKIFLGIWNIYIRSKCKDNFVF